MKQKIKSCPEIKSKTLFQEFADWIALCRERDDKFQLTISKRSFVAVRLSEKEAEEENI